MCGHRPHCRSAANLPPQGTHLSIKKTTTKRSLMGRGEGGGALWPSAVVGLEGHCSFALYRCERVSSQARVLGSALKAPRQRLAAQLPRAFGPLRIATDVGTRRWRQRLAAQLPWGRRPRSLAAKVPATWALHTSAVGPSHIVFTSGSETGTKLCLECD